MTVDESITLQSVVEQARAIKQGDIASVELLELYLSRIERYNPVLNAIVSLDVERARKAAKQADEARTQGRQIGPLHGVPITLKDAWETEGLRTTAGDPRLTDYIPTTDATTVTRLREAGAIVVGKTNMPTQNRDYQSSNPVFGTTNNPWNTSLTPGGSAGGAATSVSAGLSAFDFASEIGGSIRIPAHYTGIYGHKSSLGLVPLTGHIPLGPGVGDFAEIDMAVGGPLARSAEDLALALQVTARPKPAELTAWRLELPASRATTLRDFRVAAWLDDPFCPVGSEVATALGEVVSALEKAGVSVDRHPSPPVSLPDSYALYERLVYSAFSTSLPQQMFDAMVQMTSSLAPEDTSAPARSLRASTQRHRDWLEAHATSYEFQARWAPFFRTYDVLLMPITPTPAVPHQSLETDRFGRTIQVDGKERSYWDQAIWNCVANVNTNPATAAPIGLSPAGLPIGMQIMGPYLEDMTTITFAKHLAQSIGGYQTPPGY